MNPDKGGNEGIKVQRRGRGVSVFVFGNEILGSVHAQREERVMSAKYRIYCGTFFLVVALLCGGANTANAGYFATSADYAAYAGWEQGLADYYSGLGSYYGDSESRYYAYLYDTYATSDSYYAYNYGYDGYYYYDWGSSDCYYAYYYNYYCWYYQDTAEYYSYLAYYYASNAYAMIAQIYRGYAMYYGADGIRSSALASIGGLL